MPPKPIIIAPAPQPAAPIDRESLAAQVTVARAVAERCLQAVVASGVFRDAGLSVSAALNARADVLTTLLEQGATDAEIASWLPGFNGLIGDAHKIATDPAAVQARHDLLAVGPHASAATQEPIQP